MTKEDREVLTPVDKVLCLQDVDVFRHATTEMLAYIASIAHELRMAKGHVIFAQEDESDSMYVIVSGRVRLERENKEIMTLGQSESFGTWALFDNQPRLMTAVAIEEGRLLKIRSEEFYDLLSDHEEITPAIFKAVIARVRSLVADNDRSPQDEDKTKLIQSEKMASLGLLAAGLAHEINTPMGAIHSNNDILSRAVAKMRKLIEPGTDMQETIPGKELKRILGILEEVSRNNAVATERIMGIVRSLKNFARLDEAQRKKADIHEGLESTLTLVRHELKGRIRVVKEYGDLPEIECFPNQLNQVFMNILVNASQAVKERGTITIRTFRDGNSIKIAISDTGVGIPPESLSKIFDPGFTTKGAGVGTGLGLSICYQIVQDHHGKIEVESSEKGSTFTINLPFNTRVSANA